MSGGAATAKVFDLKLGLVDLAPIWGAITDAALRRTTPSAPARRSLPPLDELATPSARQGSRRGWPGLNRQHLTNINVWTTYGSGAELEHGDASAQPKPTHWLQLPTASLLDPWKRWLAVGPRHAAWTVCGIWGLEASLPDVLRRGPQAHLHPLIEQDRAQAVSCSAKTSSPSRRCSAGGRGQGTRAVRSRRLGHRDEADGRRL